MNAKAVVKLIKAIIEIIKEKKTTPIIIPATITTETIVNNQ
jgi:hypothetical protein